MKYYSKHILVDELEAILAAPIYFLWSLISFHSFYPTKRKGILASVSEMSDIRSNYYRVIDVYLYRQANIII